MRTLLRRALPIAAAALLAPATVALPPANAANAHASSRAVCPAPPRGAARCHALVVTDARGNPLASGGPTGYGPAQFHGAYALPTASKSAQTIAIVDAYDDPTVKADLDAYDAAFGLPAFPTCTATITAACFQKVNQAGQTSPLPKKNAGWALEIALDVEVTHAICQNCKLLLVETNTNFNSALAAGVNTAARLGANAISNSYGSSEVSGTQGGAYDHAGIAITASAGDSGFGTEGPASYPTVIAVGGTTLNVTASNSYGGETVWSGTGSGCSAYFAARAWQKAVSTWSQTGCGTKRAVADVSADADPNTGAAVYDTTRYQGRSGWFRVGGTSLSAPLIAAVYALAANASTAPYPASITYGAAASTRHDVTSGSNGACAGTIMCRAAAGYDGPTGLGTPKGIAGF